MLKNRIQLLAILFVLATSITTAEEYIIPKGVNIFTEEQLLNKFVGNTFSNERWAEYFEPPINNPNMGKIKGKFLNTAYLGSWEVKAVQVCFKHEKAFLQTHDGCYTISLEGDITTWYRANGSVWYPRGGPLKLVPGNPNNL